MKELTAMYCPGQSVEYQTICIRTAEKTIPSQKKEGMIEEAFTTIQGDPCYWIKGEKELILHNQILRAI